MKRTRRQHRPQVEVLEDRTLLTAYVFVDFGENFPLSGGNRVLSTTVRGFRDVALAQLDSSNNPIANTAIQGPQLTDATGGSYSDSTSVSLTRFGFSTASRDTIMQMVRTVYAPLDINVVELTTTEQTLPDGRVVTAAASMSDIAATLRGNDTTTKDAYVIAAIPAIGPNNDNPNNFLTNGYGGIAPGGTVLTEDTDLRSSFNRHDDVALAIATGNLAFVGNTIAHEAGHALGLRHSVTTAAAAGSAVNNLIHTSEVMSYLSGRGATPFFSRYPMVRGDGNTDGAGASFSNTDLEARQGQATPFDQLRVDVNVGPSPAYDFVTGTGAHDIINLYQVDGYVYVSVQAFANADHTGPIPVPGGVSTVYSYSFPANKPILVYGGDGNDEIIIDSYLGVDVEIDGMLDDDTLRVKPFEYGGVSRTTDYIRYTPSPVSPLNLDGAADFAGDLELKGMNIRFSGFEDTGSIIFENVRDLSIFASSGKDEIAILRNGMEQTLSGMLNTQDGGGVGMAPLTLTNVDQVTLNTRGFQDLIDVESFDQNTRWFVNGGGGNDRLRISPSATDLDWLRIDPATRFSFNGNGGADWVEVFNSASDQQTEYVFTAPDAFFGTGPGVSLVQPGPLGLTRRLFEYESISDLSLFGSPNGDTFRVDYVAPEAALVLRGGDDVDRFLVGAGDVLSNTGAGVTIRGEGGADELVIDDTDTKAGTVYVPGPLLPIPLDVEHRYSITGTILQKETITDLLGYVTRTTGEVDFDSISHITLLASGTTGNEFSDRAASTIALGEFSRSQTVTVDANDGVDAIIIDTGGGSGLAGSTTINGGDPASGTGDTLTILGNSVATGTSTGGNTIQVRTPLGTKLLTFDITFTGLEAPPVLREFDHFVYTTPFSYDQVTVSIPDVDRTRISGSSGGVRAGSSAPVAVLPLRPLDFVDVRLLVLDTREHDDRPFNFAGESYAPYPNDTVVVEADGLAGVTEQFEVRTGSGNNQVWEEFPTSQRNTGAKLRVDGSGGATFYQFLNSGAMDSLAVDNRSSVDVEYQAYDAGRQRLADTELVGVVSHPFLTIVGQAISGVGSTVLGQFYLYFVRNTNSSGAGSLRNAMLLGNEAPTDGTAIVTFAIPISDPGHRDIDGALGGDPDADAFVIRPASALPGITRDGLIINGQSQRARTGDRNPNGPEVVLDGSLTVGNGFILLADDSVLNGLNIHSFGSSGVVVRGERNLVTDSYIGTDPTGTLERGNGGMGVFVVDASGNTIRDNLISGNTFNGVVLAGITSTGNVLQDNRIGTDRTGTFAIGNTLGVHIADASGSRLVGNLISGNLVGVDISGITATNNEITGNLIGTGADVSHSLGNRADGVFIDRAPGNLLRNNVIAWNGFNGIIVGGDTATGNAIRENTIHSNGRLGIDLGGDGVSANDPNGALDTDTGPNNLQNFPVFNQARKTTRQILIRGKLHSAANADYVVDIFVSSRNGGGGRLLTSIDVTTGADGVGEINLNLPLSAAKLGEYISATATRVSTNDTSEFSRPMAVAGTDYRGRGPIIVGGGALFAASSPAQVAPSSALTGLQVQPLVEAAAAHWGVQVPTFDIRIADLGGTTLGFASGNTIWLDDDAAGWGWFVDPTPWDDAEFLLDGDQGEQGRMDLLSVLEHEIGHLLGHDHSEAGVMQETLTAGERLSMEASLGSDAFWAMFDTVPGNGKPRR